MAIPKDAPAAIRASAMATFLADLRVYGNVSHAAIAADIGRTTAYAWRERYVTFARAWDDALEEACDLMELEARRRAIEGTDEPVHYLGEQVDTVKKYSDTLLIFLLKGHRPEKYAERRKDEITGPDGGPILVKGYGNVSPDEWDGDQKEEN